MKYKNEQYLAAYYSFLKERYGAEFAAGVCGNIQSETANTFDPKQVQLSAHQDNDVYTSQADAGINNFITDGWGYGPFQYTTARRKGLFYDRCKQHGYSVGYWRAHMEYFEYEITTTGYANVRKAIKEHWSVEECARIICEEYERPKSMQIGGEVKEQAIQKRINYALAIYEYFEGEKKEEGKIMKAYDLTICEDPGHYGKVNRSPVVPEYYESDFTWKFVQYKATELRRLGFNVIITRDNKDKDLALVSRGKKAKNCVIFMSEHSNACGTESVDHPSIIVPRAEGDANINDCTVLANRIGANIQQVMGCKQAAKVYSRDAEYDRNGDKKGGNDEYYGVLHGAQTTNCPIYMIIEHGFHTNINNAQWLLNDANVKKLAVSEATIVANFLKEKYDLTITGDEHIDISNDFNEVTAEITYKVKKGDTLGKIARDYHTTVAAICEANRFIVNPNNIQPGWVLIIPFEKKDLPQYHIVDTKADGLNSLSKIAKRYGITLEQIKTLNPQVTPPKYIIKNGDKIRIK